MKARYGSLVLIPLALLLTLTGPGQGTVAAAALHTAGGPVSALPAPHQNQTSVDVPPPDMHHYAYLPIIYRPTPEPPPPPPLNCNTGSSYASGIAYRGETPPIIPANFHPDKNLAVRGYVNAGTQLSGPTGQSGDYYTEGPRAPKLNGLFSPSRLPSPFYLYQVHDWNWNHSILPYHGTPGTLLEAGTMISLPATIGELITVPSSGYDIGAGMEVIVLYADASRLTIRIGRDDTGGTVPNLPGYEHPGVGGYVIHIEGICVDPSLLALYQSLDQNGTGPRYNNYSFNLPTLAAGQPVGKASSTRVGVAIRDSGQFTLAQLQDWWVLP